MGKLNAKHLDTVDVQPHELTVEGDLDRVSTTAHQVRRHADLGNCCPAAPGNATKPLRTTLVDRLQNAGDNGDWRAALAILERRWPELRATRQPAPAAAPSITIDLVLQIPANVVALGAPAELLQLVGDLAHAFGLTSGGSGTRHGSGAIGIRDGS